MKITPSFETAQWKTLRLLDLKKLLLLIPLTLCALPPVATAISPQEINTKECRNYVASLYDGFPKLHESKFFNRDHATLNCTKEMNENYKNGLPSYATHTPNEIKIYREEKTKNSALEFRAKSKEKLEMIKNSCAAPVVNIYAGMYAEKAKGVQKSAQVNFLRNAQNTIESKSVLDAIVLTLSYEALDEIYSATGPTTDAEVANRIFAFHKKCREMYEQAMFLR